MLEDYIFDDHLRYQGHKLIYTFPEPTEEPIVIGGILGAAILCVRLINTDEQVSREIVLDEKLHYEPFFIRYEQEVIGDDWGYIAAELEQLDLAYMELYSQEQVTIETLCPNIRQLSIAMDVMQTYELYQFRRAWNELRRYHPAVQDEVNRLAACGVKSITSSSQHIRQ